LPDPAKIFALFVRRRSGWRSGMGPGRPVSEAIQPESRFGGTGKIFTQYGKVVDWDGRTL
jgi:hypothetical protein